MPLLGLTGAVGTGKSLALEILEELGAETLEADKAGHELLQDPEVKQAVVALLGPGVVGADGELDRTRIGEVVFSDEEMRNRYNGIIHPCLLSRIKEWLDARRETGEAAVVAAALIPEWGIEGWFHEVWCIRCSDETALSRWKRDPETYWRIRKAQYAPERKQAQAERVIDNERSQEEYRRRIEAEFERFKASCPGSGGR
jgi:dephospho-CoA kinase